MSKLPSKILKKSPWIIAAILAGVCWLLPELLPWILLVAVVFVCRFMPKRGLIGPVQLPADDAFLPDEAVQWWYWTGHLVTDKGKRFGFEVVFFTFDNFIMRDQLVQAAITNVDDNSFVFEEFVELHLPKRIKNRFDLTSGKSNKVTAVGGGGIDRLHSEVGKYVLDLDLKSTKPAAMHYGGNAHPYVFGGFTYYYSRTHMEANGTLKIDGKSYKVTGTSWFDRQYGELDQAISQGWQWFAIELDDNRQIMLFDFIGKEEEALLEKTGSITDAAGLTTTLAPQDYLVNITDYWTSPVTGCKYPSGWDVTVRGEKFNIQPLVKDQELSGNHSFWIGPKYWEGACSVSGDISGKAYVELDGYCKD